MNGRDDTGTRGAAMVVEQRRVHLVAPVGMADVLAMALLTVVILAERFFYPRTVTGRPPDRCTCDLETDLPPHSAP